MRRIIALASVLIVGAVVVAAAGDKPPRTPAAKPATEVVTRFYDIRELLRNIPDFSAPDVAPSDDRRGGGIGGGGLFSDGVGTVVAGRTREEASSQMIRLIVETIDPESWRDTGGSIGSIRTIGQYDGTFIVIQTPENQKRIAELLAGYIKANALAPVRIRAHWILTRRSELTGILKPVTGRPNVMPPAGKDTGPISSALLEADDAALDRIAGAVHYRGELLCLDGQRAYIVASGQQYGTTDAPPAEPTALFGTPGSTESGGLVLDVTNLVNADRTAVITTFRSQWVSSSPSASRPPPGRPTTSPSTAPADPIAISTAPTDSAQHDIRTTVPLPFGKTILIGGMTTSHNLHAPRPARADAQRPGEEIPQLYLFVEATGQ